MADLIFNYLSQICEEISIKLQMLKWIKDDGGYFEKERIAIKKSNIKKDSPGIRKFIRFLDSEYKIRFHDPDLIVEPIEKHKVIRFADNQTELIPHINPKNHKATLSEGGRMIIEFVVEEKMNSFIELVSFYKDTLEEYLEIHGNIEVSDFLDKLGIHVIDNYFDSPYLSEYNKRKNHDILLLMRDQNFQETINRVKGQILERYHSLLILLEARG